VFVAAVPSLIPRSEGMATMHGFGGDSGFYDHHSSTGGSRASTEGSVPAVGTHSDDVPIVGSDEPSPFFVKLMEERASVAAHLKANAQETLPPGQCGYCLGKATLAGFKALDHEMEKQGVHYKMAYVNGSIYVDELASPAHCLISSQFDQLVNSYEDALKARYHQEIHGTDCFFTCGIPPSTLEMILLFNQIRHLGIVIGAAWVTLISW
jgi:hypothetical protein